MKINPLQHLIIPLPWQTEQWQNLIKRHRNNQLPHALLLHGMPGLGKQLFVQEFIKWLLCKAPLTTDKSCAQCRSCLLIQAGNYAEIYGLQPESPSKIIRIDQIRELTEQLNQTPQLGSYKIAVITPAEAMPPAAANALLKTLEEPAGHTYLFLVTSKLGLLPATIRSRCQKLLFAVPEKQMATQWLAEQVDKDQDWELLLALAEGAPLQAIASIETQTIRQQLIAGLVALSQKKMDPVQCSVAQLKQPFTLILDSMLSIIMDVMRIKQGFPQQSVSNRDSMVFLSATAATMTAFDLFSYFDKLFKLKLNLAAVTSLNQQLLLEDLFCTFYSYERSNNTHA
jgi:DNA polymerase III subunit delta'